MSATQCFHQWNENILNENISFQLIRYSEKCCFLWIGNAAQFDTLACAMCTPYEKAPLTTDILNSNKANEDLIEKCNELSRKLASKLNKQVVVSFNVQPADMSTWARINNLIEKHLFDKIKMQSHLF